MDKPTVFWEGEHSSSGIKANARVPVGQVRRRFSNQIAINSLEVEVPRISAFSLAQIVKEEVSPFGANDSVLQLVADCCIGTIDVEIRQSSEAVSELSEILMVILVHRGCIESEVASDIAKMIAGGSQSNFSTETMSSEGGHGYFVFVHEAGNVV